MPRLVPAVGSPLGRCDSDWRRIPSSTAYLLSPKGALKLLAQTGYRYVELFPVFGYRPAGNIVSFFLQDLSQLFIRKGLPLILVCNAFFQDLLHFAV